MSPDFSRLLVDIGRSPSGDNCQPWRFRVNGQWLEVDHDEQLARHALNRANHASLLALGCLAEALTIAAAEQGFSIELELPLERPWLRARFSLGGSRDALYPALKRRETDRRIFKGGDLPDLEGVQRLVRVPPALMSYLAETESIVFRTERMHQDLMHWIRFDADEIARATDGMPWPNLGVSYVESRVLKVARRPSIQRGLNRLGFLIALRAKTRKAIASAAGLFLVTVRTTEPIELVAAGRRAMRAWLTLTMRGYGVQPLTVGSLGVYDEATGRCEPELSPLMRRGRRVLTEAFKLNPDEIPVWLFRTGVSTPLPDLARTPRR